MKKTFNRIKIGVIKGWTTPNLPDHIIKLQLHPLIRIFRFISGISLLLILTRRISYFHDIFLYLAILNCIFYAFYQAYIGYHRIKHIYYLIKNKDLDVRNSPLDKLATLASRLIACAKGACETAAPIGVSIGIMAGVDSMLEHKGRNPLFLPFIADILIPESPEEKYYKEKRKNFIDLNTLQKRQDQHIEEDKVISSLKSSGLFSQEDIDLMKEGLHKQEQELIKNKDELVKKITEHFEKKLPKK